MRTIALALLVAACSTPARSPATTAPPRPTTDPIAIYLRVYGGLAGVYRSIADETDCAGLQEEFYTATDNATLGYQVAIKDRAKAIGCPEIRFTRP